jgi:hypothetical protein
VREEVDIKDWDPNDPNQKKIKIPSRKYSFEVNSNKKRSNR